MLHTPEQVALGLARNYRGLDQRDGLPRIAAPTLVIGAEGDPSTPAFRFLEIARLAIAEGVGHFVLLERPDEVNQAVQEFLSGHGF